MAEYKYSKRIETIKTEIIKACRQSGRDPKEVKVIAVSKTHPAETIYEAYLSGQKAFGENRVQELLQKMDSLPEEIEWHLIGTLQRNKVKYLPGKVALIHSVDSLRLAREISKHAVKNETIMPVLLQVNIAGELTKHGFTEEETVNDIKEIASLPGIKIKGLMTIAPLSDNPEDARPVFCGLRMLAERLKRLELVGVEMTELSMGMSDDFSVAVEEGATIVRIGSRIFGERENGRR